MKKTIQITYNPYDSKLNFKTLNPLNKTFADISSGSDLCKYVVNNVHVMFSNCVNDIVNIINKEQNTTAEGLEIQFFGTDADFLLLKKTVSECSGNSNAGELTCHHKKRFASADDNLSIIKNAYNKISDEFTDYLPGKEKYKSVGPSIGNTISQFEEITSKEIPICVIGTYSVGKSAFINALIGEEILPSHVNPSTAKNVKIIRSNSYWIEFDYLANESSKKTKMRFQVKDGSLSLMDADGPQKEIASEIGERILKAVKNDDNKESVLLHSILDYFNETQKDDFLKNIQFNVSVGVPFSKSILTETDEKIVIYDTPGSNNSDIDQQVHKEALKELMLGQTNALPILVTDRNSLLSDDTQEIKNMLDEYAENFSCTNCIVVCSKGDQLTITQLKEEIKPQIKGWHGGTAVLYTTPVGAIGEKKENKSAWIDKDYKDFYKRWKQNMNGEFIVLPEYNIIPCINRESISNVEIDSDSYLYATGIPSIELEILYYIRDYANYRKCVRGKQALEKAINAVKDELKDEKKNANNAKSDASTKKIEKRQEFINELRKIPVENIAEHIDDIDKKYSDLISTYISGLSDYIGKLYDSFSSKKTGEMDKEINKNLQEHCQENLIDKCYKDDNGIQEIIKDYFQDAATKYIDELKRFVSKNETSISEDGMAKLKEYLDEKYNPPVVEDVQSGLANLINFIPLVSYGIIKNVIKDEEKAKAKWVDAKKTWFEEKLINKNKHSGKIKPGLFRECAIEKPMKEYNSALKKWAADYSLKIEECLNEDNAILSGLEEEIQRLADVIDDLTRRYDHLKGVEEELSGLLELVDLK